MFAVERVDVARLLANGAELAQWSARRAGYQSRRRRHSARTGRREPEEVVRLLAFTFPRIGKVGVVHHDDHDPPMVVRDAERLMPTSADIPNNLGIAPWREGKTEEAISSFRRALQIDSGQGARQNLEIALGP